MKKLNEKAKTAEEFKAKYGRKRFTSSTVGKAHILSYIYWAYLKKEGLSNDELLAQPLYKNLSSMSEKITYSSDIGVFDAYIRLEEWLGNTLEAALLVHNATKNAFAHFYSIASGAIAGEELRNALGAQADEGNVAIWLSALSFDSIRPKTASYETVLVLRQNIDKGLRYVNVYNTLVRMITKAIEIPELDVFLLDMEPIRTISDQLNGALYILRDDIRKRETVPDEQAATTTPPLFTEKELETTLEAFRDVSPDAPPIPEDNITYTERNLRLYAMSGYKAWSNLFTMLSRDYWRL